MFASTPLSAGIVRNIESSESVKKKISWNLIHWKSTINYPLQDIDLSDQNETVLEASAIIPFNKMAHQNTTVNKPVIEETTSLLCIEVLNQ